VAQLNSTYKLMGSNQIRVVAFMCTTFLPRFIFTKKSNVAKCFLISVFNCEIAQCSGAKN